MVTAANRIIMGCDSHTPYTDYQLKHVILRKHRLINQCFLREALINSLEADLR